MKRRFGKMVSSALIVLLAGTLGFSPIAAWASEGTLSDLVPSVQEEPETKLSETGTYDYQLNINGAQEGAAISPTLNGIFLEDINYAGDGGLYAELIQNRSFEFEDSLRAWSKVTEGGGTANLTVESSQPLNAKNLHYARLTVQSPGADAGLANAGFGGMAVERGLRYDFSVYARSIGAFQSPLRICLQNASSETIGEATIEGITNEWQKLTATLTASETATAAKLSVTTTGAGSVDLDMVSLFPQNTWKNRPGGLRADLVQAMADMKPKFIRFPGGSIVGGRSVDNFYRWKNTIGDVAERPINKNFWSDPARGNDPYYYQTGGLGFYEYFLLSEDLGAEPLPVINVGMAEQFLAPGVVVPLAELQPYIQDALDLIEYANGPVTSEWGAKRAAAGHPEPFNLKYLSLGNEHWTSAYFDRYQRFYDAIKAVYPSINLMLSSGAYASGAEFSTAWSWARQTGKAQVVDEHMYQPSAWFLSNTKRYDSYNRNDPPVFVGEYAAHIGSGDKGRLSNLQGAISEAAFMTGLERNGDVVRFASYAPTFAKDKFVQWTPDLIWFNNTDVFCAPSYYVQQMFSANVGDHVVDSELLQNEEQEQKPVTGKVMLASWSTAVDYDDLLVTAANGETLLSDDFSGTNSNWNPSGGTWQVTDGVMRQSSTATPARNSAGDVSWNNYTITLKATKKSGNEGMLIGFGVKDTDNYYWWNIGGWGNTRTLVEKAVGGSKTEASLVNTTFRVETNKTYQLKIELSGSKVRCFIDGELIHEFTDSNGATSPLYSVVSKDNESGDMIVKLVNNSPDTQTVNVNLEDVPGIETRGTAIVLASDNISSQNTFADPYKVAPVTNVLPDVSDSFLYDSAPNSVSILRLKTRTGIVAAATAAVSTEAGQAPQLPETIEVTGSDGTISQANVEWHPVRAFKYEQPGSFTVQGTIADAAFNVYGHVTVKQGEEPPQAAIPALIVKYGFDEASGTTVSDSTYQGHNGTLEGTVKREPDGKKGAALTFAGSGGNYINAGTSEALQPDSLTLSYWIKRTSDMNSAENVLLWFKPTNGYNQNGLFITYNGTNAADPISSFVVVDGFNGFYVKQPPNDFLPLNEWKNVVITFDSDTNDSAIYKNGIKQEIAVTGTPDSITATADVKKIGVSGYNNGAQLQATLDDFRIYGGAMSDSQVKALYDGKLIEAVQPAAATTIAGSAPKLPKAVTVTYENGSTAAASVAWDAVAPSEYAEPGSFSVNGTVEGTALKAVVIVTVTAPPAPIPHLVAHYTFDEQTGTEVGDTSGKGHHGLAEGDDSEWINDGHEGGAMKFNGTNQYVDLGDSGQLQPKDITVSYWIKRTVTMNGRNNNILWFKDGWNGNGFYITYDGSNLDDVSSSYLIVDGFNGFYVNESPDEFLPLGEWTHIAVTFDSTTKQGAIYKNGISQTLTVNGTPASITPSSTKSKMIGMSEYANSHLNAALDDLRIYDVAMTEADIKALYEGEPDSQGSALISGPSAIASSAEFDVTVSLQGVEQSVLAQDMVITYDADKLEWIGVKELLLNSNFVKVGEDLQPGTARIMLVNIGETDASVNGELLMLRLRAKSMDGQAAASINVAKLEVANGEGVESVLTGASMSIMINAIDKEALIAMINEAQDIHNAAVEGTKAGQYPAGAKALLQAAIGLANTVAENSDSTAQLIEQATAELQSALSTFKATVIKGLPGDVNGDERISIGDLGIVSASYGKTSNDPQWSIIQKGDLNKDGKIDIEDLAALARQMING
ncbi:LamG-like jellyroll fold domain-containing protein [Paenibacillus sp. LHD-38]|uniref:LamG-like jellyroll fold domain-containing protein n=1 Tax=Paenibacillus sp. LHD-38 TaxID=3072143 RepID=UPI00280CB4E5|nr:LamG-like jellyroll fold domain-containing protein [Paenibacillus sp. LHD-38]MDQ8737707.1 LamG-like jellyroll fold domain-containing protein [Paenibacillus sp. LHD-38]